MGMVEDRRILWTREMDIEQVRHTVTRNEENCVSLLVVDAINSFLMRVAGIYCGLMGLGVERVEVVAGSRPM